MLLIEPRKAQYFDPMTGRNMALEQATIDYSIRTGRRVLYGLVLCFIVGAFVILFLVWNNDRIDHDIARLHVEACAQADDPGDCVVRINSSRG